jgi:hypothetical protein
MVKLMINETKMRTFMGVLGAAYIEVGCCVASPFSPLLGIVGIILVAWALR